MTDAILRGLIGRILVLDHEYVNRAMNSPGRPLAAAAWVRLRAKNRRGRLPDAGDSHQEKLGRSETAVFRAATRVKLRTVTTNYEGTLTLKCESL